jgi:CDK inhibitor PHO81
MVPALIESIKELGLVLVADTSDEGDGLAVPVSGPGGLAPQGGILGMGGGAGLGMGSYKIPEGVNGVLRGNGVLRFNESIDR